MDRVIRWMRAQNVPENAAILDIGTGNGMFLVELASQVQSSSAFSYLLYIQSF